SIETELRRVEANLGASNPRFYQTVNPQAEVMSLDEVSTALPGDTALLQYYFQGDDVLAWAITQQGLVHIHRAHVDVKMLERKMRSFNQACKGQRRLDELGSTLAEVLLTPLAEAIRRNSQLIVVPYGASHLLPFHALPW